MIGVFLAVLELVRHHSVRAEQNDLHGEIWIVPDAEFDPNKEIVAADDYGAKPISDDMQVGGR
jgi:segregation and condensation protein A